MQGWRGSKTNHEISRHDFTHQNDGIGDEQTSQTRIGAADHQTWKIFLVERKRYQRFWEEFYVISSSLWWMWYGYPSHNGNPNIGESTPISDPNIANKTWPCTRNQDATLKKQQEWWATTISGQDNDNSFPFNNEHKEHKIRQTWKQNSFVHFQSSLLMLNQTFLGS